MHIGIDTSPLKDGHMNRGVGGYTKNLIEALLRYESGHTFHVFDSRKQIPAAADIVHYPYFDPFTLTLPLWSPKPTVVTVHDLTPIVFPEHFPKGLRGSIKWEIQRHSLRRKQRIITDSECSGNDIRKTTGIAADKIDVVYLASSLQKPAESKKPGALKKRYGIKGDYFLYVGDVNWNKNIPGLLRAFSSFIIHHSSFSHLVLVGKAFLDTTLQEAREINSLISGLTIGEHIIKTGYVDDETLALLYGQARALIQPSLYEGFGLPVLEAMSLGCPVICSAVSSLKEIAGPSMQIDPNSPESIEKAMAEMSSLSGRVRSLLVRRGLEWSARFTWQKTAENTVRSYEKVLGNK